MRMMLSDRKAGPCRFGKAAQTPAFGHAPSPRDGGLDVEGKNRTGNRRFADAPVTGDQDPGRRQNALASRLERLQGQRARSRMASLVIQEMGGQSCFASSPWSRVKYRRS